jgi:hypothetical protein
MSKHALPSTGRFGLIVAAFIALAACANMEWNERLASQDELGHSGFEGGPGLGVEAGQGL